MKPTLAALFLALPLLLSATPQAPAGAHGPLTVDYVLGLMQAGLQPQAIEDLIQHEDLTFVVRAGDADRLRAAGADSALVGLVTEERAETGQAMAEGGAVSGTEGEDATQYGDTTCEGSDCPGYDGTYYYGSPAYGPDYYPYPGYPFYMSYYYGPYAFYSYPYPYYYRFGFHNRFFGRPVFMPGRGGFGAPPRPPRGSMAAPAPNRSVSPRGGSVRGGGGHGHGGHR